MRFTLTIVDPPMFLNANQRLHWATEARLTKQWRTLGWLHARDALNAGRLKPVRRARIECWMTWPDDRERDPNNYNPTAKALIDGVVGDAGLLPKDDSRHLIGPDMRRGEKGPRRVELIITELLEEE